MKIRCYLNKRIALPISMVAVLISSFSMSANAQGGKYGALAIDRNNGFYYGWAVDYDTQSAANNRALNECKKRGGNCTIVKQWSGGYCAVYRTIDGNVGTAYGWGVARTRTEADRIASNECRKRSYCVPCDNYVWGCNSRAPKEKPQDNQQQPTKNSDDFWSGKPNANQQDVTFSNDFWDGKGSQQEESIFESQTKPPESNQFIGDIESYGTKYLKVKCMDHGAIDGDRVSVSLNGSTIENSITLKDYYTSFDIKLQSGQNRIDFTALNEGSSPPNTAKFIITDDQGKTISNKEWNIKKGFTATLLIVTY